MVEEKLSKEIEEGNIEYKRYLMNIDNDRFNHLVTQMNWRLNEGNNMAIYYIGVDDDGSIYNMMDFEYEETMNNIKKLVAYNNAEIISIQPIDEGAYKITIKRKTVKYKEVRIILLGPSNSGKTTFLSNIILDKVDGSTEARIYLLNHKHELETKKTSSFNCYYKEYKNYKYTFIEAPGSEKYIKTKQRIIEGIRPDIILLFSDDINDINICNEMNMKYGTNHIRINPYDGIYCCKQLIDKNKLFDMIENNISFLGETNYSLDPNTKFNIMSVYHSIDIGLIVSGFLSSGKLYTGMKLYWKYKKHNIECIVKSIHINGIPYDYVQEYQILSICLQPYGEIKKKWKYGNLLSEQSSNNL